MKNPAVARIALALLAGALFGFGLSLSGMVDPARVSGFLDIASGHWDPSLMFVLGGAIMVAAPGVLLSRRLAKPVLADDFRLPAKTRIDGPLITGSAIFGIGWGLPASAPARHSPLSALG
ncbi:hypothetical protein C241_10711 [Bradyrhizobium lupini HPC(L)]|uniref:YeeE/YedE family protein n=1 Tax=Bradyrhizobium lupini HPC(L) TaxID=1229491 RepID=A0ABN0HMQ8_RHILU|nr:hypothetical protein C241_10711 [Bradyrhizobium lupini HPC(L)]